jgi:hypothetical protein
VCGKPWTVETAEEQRTCHPSCIARSGDRHASRIGERPLTPEELAELRRVLDRFTDRLLLDPDTPASVRAEVLRGMRPLRGV